MNCTRILLANSNNKDMLMAEYIAVFLEKLDAQKCYICQYWAASFKILAKILGCTINY